MKDTTERFFGSRTLIALFLAVIGFLYQNCAQNTSLQSSRLENPANREITSYLKADQLSQVRSCQQENLKCLRKVYSPNEQDRQTNEEHCLDQNGPCLDVNTVYYNTTFAIQECHSCGPEDALVGGEYNREEVTCWVGEPAAENSISYALRSNLKSAAIAALATCGGALR
ncbi:MAG: hypothetical protein IPM97_11195 [Bdellovibrionaceae bacterium]|nr:hypothetical protein [Pseudobdellovibrionaceae bacterium]